MRVHKLMTAYGLYYRFLCKTKWLEQEPENAHFSWKRVTCKRCLAKRKP